MLARPTGVVDTLAVVKSSVPARRSRHPEVMLGGFSLRIGDDAWLSHSAPACRYRSVADGRVSCLYIKFFAASKV